MPEPKTKIINGLQFLISQPYAEGHTITAAEAKALNQTRSENIGNNLRTKIKEMQDAGADESAIQAIVTEADNSYEFTLARVAASRQLDPVEREARKIARELLKAHLAKTGRKLNVVPEGETEDSWSEKVEAQLDALVANPELLAEARKNVAAKSKQADKLASLLD